MKHVLLLFAAIVLTLPSLAQQLSVSGKVIMASDGAPVPGTSVVVKGTQTGTITDVDGNFALRCDEGSTLVFSFIGMETQELAATANMTVQMEDEVSQLDEIVAVGYGVQKKSVVTASIAKVSADDLEGKTRLRAEDALKGLASGITVTSASGQPGAKSQIRIRGNGTINNSNPLYIIDGMPTDQNGMELVNPSDIESIEVLKDAASGAIYGARAANGVILVTTKKGKQGKAQINYNFSYGLQSAWHKRDVTSATDYAILQNEKYVNSGQAPVFADPYNLVDINGDRIEGFGTDWQDLVFNDNAPIMQHDVSISGATERTNYYVSAGYFDQEGIVGGNYGHSNYNRLTLRSNNIYTVIDEAEERSFLNSLEAGVNLSYMRVNNTGIDANSTWGSVLGSALYLSPMLPVTAKGTTAEGMIEHFANYDLYYDGAGNPYTIPGYFGSYGEQNNPVAMLQGTPTKNWAHKFMPKFSLDLQLWDQLKYRITYSGEFSFWGNEGATKQKFYLSGNNNSDHTQASAYKGNNSSTQLENVLTYAKTIDRHQFDVVLGQSVMQFKGDELGGSRWDLVNTDKPSINYATGDVEYATDADGNITGASAHFGVYGGPYTRHKVASFFGRLSYNYAERYMVQATVRRDGSSRFGDNNRYGNFPSFSLGWNVLNESFMESARDIFSNIKLRYSWGKNGSDNIVDFAYTTLTSMGNDYLFGTNQVLTNGSKANRLANPDLKWEESEQSDFGIDVGMLGNALTLSVDYYIKKTNGMIIEMPIPSYVGESKPYGNVGDMKNSGVEMEIGYKWKVADAKFDIKGNASYLKNELTNLGNDTGFLDFGISQFSDGGTRAENGQPFPYFYGYRTKGIFQNEQEVAAYTNAAGELIQPDARPGDLRFADVNGDGRITSDDRTNIGNGTPKWTFGFNLNAEWKGIDFGAFFQGVSGVDVFDATYRQDITAGNYPTWMLDRWTGEGTSNRVPRLGFGSADSKNWAISDLYVHDASYLRLKNIQLGYTLPRQLTQRIRIDRLRIYAMAENLATWTKYWGFDPEIGHADDDGKGTAVGVDYGIYPQAHTFTVGLNLSL